MTVYVDDMQMTARVGRLTAEWSHMMADTREELVEFATAMGLHPRWIQDKRSGVHFDVTEPKRQAAIRRGAVEIECGSDQWSRVVDEARQQYSGPDRRPRRFPDSRIIRDEILARVQATKTAASPEQLAEWEQIAASPGEETKDA